MKISGIPIRDRIAYELEEIVVREPARPTLAIVVVGNDAVVQNFVRAKKAFGGRIGVQVEEIVLPWDTKEDDVVDAISRLGGDDTVSGIVVQLPLPPGIDLDRVLSAIPREKDVDVLSPVSVDCFREGDFTILPPVVGAVKELLLEAKVRIEEESVVIFGQGRLVGLPLALWLRAQGMHPLCIDKDTAYDHALVRSAGLVITGVGIPGFIRPEMLSTRAFVVDAGTSESSGRVVGDMSPECEVLVRGLTPVPGGVGPVTVAVLFRNLIILHRKRMNGGLSDV